MTLIQRARNGYIDEAVAVCPAPESVAVEPTAADAVIAGDIFLPTERFGLLSLVELVLKDRPRLEWTIRDASLSAELIPRFLAIALIGFTLFGVAAAVVIGSVGVWPELTSIRDRLAGAGHGLIEFVPRAADAGAARAWFDGSAFRLILAYNFGLIAASGVCLPSLYFYGLLSGVRMSMLDVVVHTLKAKAVSAVALVGILPIYVAFAMGVAIFPAPTGLVELVLRLGLILPFIAGLWGVRSLYTGFMRLTDTLPIDRRCRRACFLRRLVLSWAACYTAVTPVMIFTVWEYLAKSGV